MRKFVFCHKRIPFRLLCFANCLNPIFVLISGASSTGNKIFADLNIPIAGPLNVANLLSAVGCLLHILIGSIYIRKSFKFHRITQHYYFRNSQDIKNTNFLFKGLLFFSFSVLLLISFSSASFISSASNKSTFYISSYVGAFLTMILSITSNVFLYSYEWKRYFQIYYPKYKNTDIPEILSYLDQKKKNQFINKYTR